MKPTKAKLQKLAAKHDTNLRPMFRPYRALWKLVTMIAVAIARAVKVSVRLNRRRLIIKRTQQLFKR